MKFNILKTILPACLITVLCGCATARTSKKTETPKVQTLDTSLSALKEEFNRDPSKPRLLALFSPTCGGCIYGAEALQHEAQKVPRLADDTELLVVWVYMLDSDNEGEARAAAERFDFPGARHFYDGKNEVGRLLRASSFLTLYEKRSRSSLPIIQCERAWRRKRISHQRSCESGTRF